MKIILTVKELVELGLWERAADKKGIEVWSLNEGIIDENEPIELTKEEAEDLGIIR